MLRRLMLVMFAMFLLAALTGCQTEAEKRQAAVEKQRAEAEKQVVIQWIVGGLLLYGAFNLWLIVYRPELYAQKQREEHERKIKNKEIAGKLARPLGAILGAVLKKKYG